MCGIVGYTGMREATEVLMTGLGNLEYRGYDSAGVSVVDGGIVKTVKAKGRLAELVALLKNGSSVRGDLGIGHTRWATHGEPSDRNSHPHTTNNVSLVHNGIIENYLELKGFLADNGYSFTSETDTETAAKLIDYYYEGDPIAAIRSALLKIKGSYAFGVIFSDKLDSIYAVRHDSPLIVGLGEGENFIASDVPAILEYTRDYYLLEEGEIAEVKSDSVVVRDINANIICKERMTATWSIEQAQKGGYDHFMMKEINEQPRALTDTVHPRITDGLPDFSADGLEADFFSHYKRVIVVACGTAWHAGMVGKSLIEKLARIPVEVDLASEFRYRNPIITHDTLVVVVSQSGETADTLAALRLARQRGVSTLAIVNVAGSSIAREADYVVYTHAGPEIAVASTKAFSVQISIFYLFAFAFAKANNICSDDEIVKLTEGLLSAIESTKEVLPCSDRLKDFARNFLDTKSLFYLGRGVDYSLAMEGSLKLKEISYIHSEAYAAGELKHGTISLITAGVPVVGLVTQRELLPKIVSNIKETRARGAYVFVITRGDFEIEPELYDEIQLLPAVDDIFLPLLSVIVLQLFAYHISVARGCDVDKPRNLAKSVTVE